MGKKKSATINPEVGKYIREVRKANGLTLEELAMKAGYSHTYVSRIELAERSLRDVSAIKSLADAMGVSFWVLIQKIVPEEFEKDSPMCKNVFPTISSKSQERALSEMVRVIVDSNFTDSEIHLLSEFVKLYAESKKNKT